MLRSEHGSAVLAGLVDDDAAQVARSTERHRWSKTVLARAVGCEAAHTAPRVLCHHLVELEAATNLPKNLGGVCLVKTTRCANICCTFHSGAQRPGSPLFPLDLTDSGTGWSGPGTGVANTWLTFL